MKKLVLLLLLMCTSLLCNAQERKSEYSVFVIVSFEEQMDNTDFTINIDNGKTVSMLRDENEDKIRFRTPAAALTYFESLGWEFREVGVSKKDNDDFTFWIFKKPVSREEYFDMVDNAIKK